MQVHPCIPPFMSSHYLLPNPLLRHHQRELRNPNRPRLHEQLKTPPEHRGLHAPVSPWRGYEVFWATTIDVEFELVAAGVNSPVFADAGGKMRLPQPPVFLLRRVVDYA